MIRYIIPVLSFSLAFLLLPGCKKKEVDLEAEWKDITVVYGLMNQNDTINYLKITKAFLGPGNALQYAKIPDSSNYPGKLNVSIEAWNGSNLAETLLFDTITITNKDSGEYFYYPYQLVYYNQSELNEIYSYKLKIINPETQNEITAETGLVRDFSIERPQPYQQINFDPDKNNQVKWVSAVGGKRYQVVLRFYYLEILIEDTSKRVEKYIDWTVFPDVQSATDEGGEEIDKYYSGAGFYSLLHAKIPVNPNLMRVARQVDYIFTVAAADLNTYIEVTEPSSSIVQEKPLYSNISNGIGLFSAMFNKVRDSLRLTTYTQQELKVNPLTKDLGF
jgi:hypothetical protein